ncbi:aminotransferase class IV [Bryobacter aggregatus]|uniref:aminotransferase class IV n=1 Tax=Bryobacter aggregatus TaxID=360054 RepID=UPI0004E10049|nr:aminotransferase class IV [Bryobacter aggregatus]
MHDLMLVNETIFPAGARTLSPGQVGAVNGWGVFSTLRVHRGVLFAWERHYARMLKDARLLQVPFPSSSDAMLAQLLRLLEANQAQEATLRVIVLRNRGGLWEGPGNDRPFDLIAFSTSLKHWGASVRLGLVPQARHAANQFAGTKMLSWSFNLCLYDQAQADGFDEVLLLNERGEVSELTSANIFAVYGNEVVTPPLSSGCLPGVTRALLLEEVQIPGLIIREAVLTPADLERADEIFITSSTRDLLAVREIQNLNIRQGGQMRAVLSAAFQSLIENYCAARTRA